MPRFGADLTESSAFFSLYQNGLYEFQTGKAKGFVTKDKDTEQIKNYGVRLSLSDPINPKLNPQPLTLYLHSEGAQKYTKQIVMAILGYNGDADGEAKFNNDFAGRGFGINVPDGEGEITVDEIYTLCENKRILINAEVGINTNTKEPQQNWGRVMKVGAKTEA